LSEPTRRLATFDGETIVDNPVTAEMRDSFIAYALSVITSRALPDIRDGLKPVQRRILYAMWEGGLRPGNPFRKSASAVGDVMKKYHPHGDSAIYDALVRMSQPWALRVPLVEGQGNFGSLDDGPAAQRYCVTGETRVRLADGTTPRIDEIVPGAAPDTDNPVDLQVIGLGGETVGADRLFHSGTHPTFTLRTVDGFALRGTGNHPVLTLEERAGWDELVWTTLETLQPGALVAIDSTEGAAGGPQLSGWQLQATVERFLHQPSRVPPVVFSASRDTKTRFLATAAPLDTPLDGVPPEAVGELQQLYLETGVVTSQVTRGGSSCLEQVQAGHTHPSGYHLSEVTSVAPSPPAPVYSLRIVTDDHAYVTAGIVSHNTEARLQPAAMAMLDSIGEDTVDFRPNYDGYDTEPVVLPAGIPNLLVNGVSGIAVGMATAIPPHNLGEVIDALVHLIEQPEATTAELMEHLPGPDFPSGGTLMGAGGLLEAYNSGRGSFKLRAAGTIEQVSERRRGLVFTELPYMVGPERIIERVRQLVREKKLEGIAAIDDHSDRHHGLKLVVEVKNGFDPVKLREQLYALTPLEDSFAFNAVALVDGVPQQVTLLDLCKHFVSHRLEVIVRRTRHRLGKAEHRAHIVEGLLIALDAIDEVVELIKRSKTTDTARTKLRKQFKLSELQADHILEMQLRRLTSMEVTNLRNELEELYATIADLRDLLDSEERQRQLCATELRTIGDRFGDRRRTKLSMKTSSRPGDVDAKIPDQPCDVHITLRGQIYRADTERGTRARKLTADRIVRHTAATSTRSKVLIVTAAGVGWWLDTLDLPNASEGLDPVKLSQLIDLGDDTPVGVVDPSQTPVLAFATRAGVIKRVEAGKLAQRSPTDVFGLADGDQLLGVADGGDGRDFVLVTSDGQLLRTAGDQVRPQGRQAGGVRGMNVGASARVVTFGTVPSAPKKDEALVVLTTGGGVKISDVREFPAKGRGGKGVRCVRFTKGESEVTDGLVGELPGPPVALSVSNRPKQITKHRLKRDTAPRRLGTEAKALGFDLISG